MGQPEAGYVQMYSEVVRERDEARAERDRYREALAAALVAHENCERYTVWEILTEALRAGVSNG